LAFEWRSGNFKITNIYDYDYNYEFVILGSVFRRPAKVCAVSKSSITAFNYM